MEIAFSKNLQHAQFQTILSLGANHCGTSRDNKTSKFFSHSFSRHNPEKLIRTLRIIGRLEDKQEDIFLEKVEKKLKIQPERIQKWQKQPLADVVQNKCS